MTTESAWLIELNEKTRMADRTILKIPMIVGSLFV
jgi:hypothetical protein